MSLIVEDVCELLDSYGGRDKVWYAEARRPHYFALTLVLPVVRLACYACKLYGCVKDEKPWQKAGSQLSHARMLLRLFDDIPTTRDTLTYGLGRHESSTAAAALGVIANLVDQVYLPVEKACWLYELGVLKINDSNAEKLDTFSTVLWAAGLMISFIRTSRSIRQLWWSRDCLQNLSEDGGADARKNLDVRLALETIVAGKLCLDITHAVSCLPNGWLWGEKIGSTKVAGIATTSSVIGIAMYFAKKRLLK